jgi:phospholipase/carboxylesterase
MFPSSHLSYIPSRKGLADMQRAQASAKFLKSLVPPAADSNISIESALFSTPAHHTAYSLFAPLHYESGYAYPLIVWLHGPGNDERQLMRIMPVISMRNYVAVAPRGICPCAETHLGRQAYGWSQSEDHVQEAEQRVVESIEAAAQSLHIARQRIFLVGFDCGGTMALRLAMDRPDRFAGVASLGGGLPTGRPSLGNLLTARRLPILLAVGRNSLEYPADQVCENLRLLHSAGMSITLRQYPCGHELAHQMLSDLDRWIIEQFTGKSQPAADADPQCSHEAE